MNILSGNWTVSKVARIKTSWSEGLRRSSFFYPYNFRRYINIWKECNQKVSCCHDVLVRATLETVQFPEWISWIHNFLFLTFLVFPSLLATFYAHGRLLFFFKVRFVISYRFANFRRNNHEHTQSLNCTDGLRIKFTGDRQTSFVFTLYLLFLIVLNVKRRGRFATYQNVGYFGYRWNDFNRPPPSTPPPPGAYEIRNCCFQSPLRGVLGLISIAPLLWWLTGLRFQRWSPTVKVDKTYRCCHYFYSRWRNFYSQWWNLQALSCVYQCKFHHQL